MQKNILIVLPFRFTLRNLYNTPLRALLEERKDWNITLATNDAGDEKSFPVAENIRFVHAYNPFREKSVAGGRKWGRFVKRQVYNLLHKLSVNRASYVALTYRFLCVQRMVRYHQIRGSHKQQFRFDPDFPFSANRLVYNMLRKFHDWSWCRYDRVERLFDKNDYDLVVLWHVQNDTATVYACEAEARNIPVLGLVHSWDNPTNRGPVSPYIDKYIVQNDFMAKRLSRHHDVPMEDIVVAGWTQMDCYSDPETFEPRSVFLEKLGLDPDAPTLFIAANSRKLGHHEPTIFAHLLDSIARGLFEKKPNVILRTHPGDPELSRFTRETGAVCVHMEEGRFDDVEHYANIVKHSDITLCTGGTAALDAMANGNKVVYLGFDAGLEVDHWQSCLRHYEYEHNAEVLETKAIPIAGSFAELDEKVNAALQGGNTPAEAQADFFDRFLTPLDGKSCERIVQTIELMLLADK